MTADDWKRVRQAVEEAIDAPPSTRRDRLRLALGDDPALMDEGLALLAAHETAGDFLESSPAGALLDDLAGSGTIAGPLTPGTQVGAFAVHEEIGRGGMGVVYRGEDTRLHRPVALKVLPDRAAASPAYRDRLRREARAAATVKHPSVATLYALEEVDGRLVLVSELVTGASLRDRLARGALTVAETRRIARALVGALSAAHRAGVIHRDLKPENIVLARPEAEANIETASTTSEGPGTRGSEVKIVDFGIARLDDPASTRLTHDGALLGTPAYMAPEQLLGTSADARVDIYAFGIVLVEMLTGRHPGGAPSAIQLDADGEALMAVALRCTQLDPALRFQDAEDVLRALEAPLAGSDTRSSARWWWEFHQAVAAGVYWAMVFPAWQARTDIGGAGGRVVFFAILGAVIVSANLRLHLLFTSRFYPGELSWVRGRARGWVRGADGAFALSLAAAGVLLRPERASLDVVFLAVAVGAAVAFLLIEPSTTRAAFGREENA